VLERTSEKKKMKKKSRRSGVKNASLKKAYNSRIRQEYIDMDYIDKLDDTKKNCKLPDGTMVTELEYIAIFMKEWNSGGVGKQKEAKKNKFHRTAKEVKACTDRTNMRNRDQYGMAKAQNMVFKNDYEFLKEFIEKEKVVSSNYVEDALIDVLDQSEKPCDSTSNGDNKGNKS